MKKVKIISVKSFCPNVEVVSSRGLGLDIRNEVEKALETFNVVVIDFSEIPLVTQSFADEILGVLIRTKGLNFVKNRIKIANANPLIKKIINFVASYSKNMTLNLQQICPLSQTRPSLQYGRTS